MHQIGKTYSVQVTHVVSNWPPLKRGRIIERTHSYATSNLHLLFKCSKSNRHAHLSSYLM
jgi:hypothetical protein